ncbi:hypothetical protein BZB76_6626 [Actinomadura pelletieri DSM 43383]|uniref:Uncharacterized protein n=1 Tax=Actinomadura pelletieri DSM 43383 TaxID=1120940 RepID=A0A495QA55_9ACTN|nr:hypothetical protein [Actinomadura pelletieri]RKS68363.1 hypothetical protein BZB76_6626 [Actinomadura pelletieri DSM 43383]
MTPPVSTTTSRLLATEDAARAMDHALRAGTDALAGVDLCEVPLVNLVASSGEGGCR